MRTGAPRARFQGRALPERERFYCAISRRAPAHRGGEARLGRGGAKAFGL